MGGGEKDKYSFSCTTFLTSWLRSQSEDEKLKELKLQNPDMTWTDLSQLMMRHGIPKSSKQVRRSAASCTASH